ncbi:MAG: metallophosphoesterase [Gammaproteobacteria bacterium]|nr:MAG: metallophosphoesterase [Gammaproteobacteria bacterium]
MKICIVSDSHDNRFLLNAAAQDAKSRGAEAILHCGDIVAPTTLRILNQLKLPVHAIHGNNTGDMYSLSKLSQDENSVIHYYGQDAAITMHNKKIFLVHYPHYALAMATTGDWDIVCCGHNHRSNIQPIENIKGQQTLLVNPGTVGGVGAEPSYVFGDLEKMQFEICHVPVKDELAYNMPPVSSHD